MNTLDILMADVKTAAGVLFQPLGQRWEGRAALALGRADVRKYVCACCFTPGPAWRVRFLRACRRAGYSPMYIGGRLAKLTPRKGEDDE
jgi:hypothetical protein